MGNYAAVTDIDAQVGGRWGLADAFGVVTTPTSTTVGKFIDQIEAEIHGILRSQGYGTIPATEAEDVSLLARYVIEKVSAMVYRSAFSGKEAPDVITTWEKDYREFLARLRRGEQSLAGQSPNGEDDPFFLIVRHPRRDDYFTSRDYIESDWDE